MSKIHQNGGISASSNQVPQKQVSGKKTETGADGKQFTKGAVIEAFCVADGKLIPISEVQDDVFSEKMLGDGYAIVPTGNTIYTPVAGTVACIFPTKHALGIQTVSGLEVLLHMGIDTVELKGAPFHIHVKEGQLLKQGDKVATVDLVALSQAGKKSDIIVAFTNQEIVDDFHLDKISQTVSANEKIGQITLK
ncbi:PTS glucose transporter subunit IIA [Lachnospiraceae bacterium ZAX-1]